MIRLNDRVALVTGGGSGIGRAAVLAFAEAGASVVVAGRRPSEGEHTVQLAREAGGNAFFRRTDVTQADDVEALVRTTVDRFGRLDFSFNNAGIEGTIGPLTELSEDDWNQTIHTNLTGVWLSLKYELAAMVRQGGGSIVNNSSNITQIGVSGTAAYSASKGGVDALTRVAAMEYAARNIRINTVNPGFVATPMIGRLFDPAFAKQLGAKNPLGKIATPEDVAHAVVWLCSPEAGHITGQTLNIGGGVTVAA